MASLDPVGGKLLSTLRRVSPTQVVAYDSEDTPRKIAVPNRRKRWDTVVNTIEARPWVRVELQDKSGAVLAYVENDGPATGLEELSDGGSAGPLAVQKYLHIMLEAQKVALGYRDKEHTSLLAGVTEVMKTQTEAIKQLAQLYQAQVSVAADVAAMQAAAEAGGDMDKVIKLVEAAPGAVGALAPLVRMLVAGMSKKEKPDKPSTPKNGTPS